MISPEYVQTMARYNTWQNAQIIPVLTTMPVDALVLDRGAFFGSLLGTANHLLWGDQAWMSRLAPDFEAVSCGIAHSVYLHQTIDDWHRARGDMDAKICDWADGLKPEDLTGALTFFSASIDAEFTQNRAVCVTHFLNHQTHHRGQIHAMLTAAGQKAPVSDLIFMPEDI